MTKKERTGMPATNTATEMMRSGVNTEMNRGTTEMMTTGGNTEIAVTETTM